VVVAFPYNVGRFAIPLVCSTSACEPLSRLPDLRKDRDFSGLACKASKGVRSGTSYPYRTLFDRRRFSGLGDAGGSARRVSGGADDERDQNGSDVESFRAAVKCNLQMTTAVITESGRATQRKYKGFTRKSVIPKSD
jgi:hypothetical protein